MFSKISDQAPHAPHCVLCNPISKFTSLCFGEEENHPMQSESYTITGHRATGFLHCERFHISPIYKF